jgi:RND superfamily putative drug exporter
VVLNLFSLAAAYGIVVFSLAAGIIIDATVIRYLLVPALMRLLGDANWWLPKWMGVVLRIPHREPEPREEVARAPPVPVV